MQPTGGLVMDVQYEGTKLTPGTVFTTLTLIFLFQEPGGQSYSNRSLV